MTRSARAPRRTSTAIRPYIAGMIESLRQAGDRPVLRWDDADTTGNQLLAAIYRYARALESLGIARGDLVAMYAPNRPEALEIDGRLVTPTALQDLLCRRPDVRYAVIVLDPGTAIRIAAVLS